jgi:hypothetical protein
VEVRGSGVKVQFWRSGFGGPVLEVQVWRSNFEGRVLVFPLLAGKSAIYNQASTTEPFGVAIVFLGACRYINNVQSLKYL